MIPLYVLVGLGSLAVLACSVAQPAGERSRRRAEARRRRYVARHPIHVNSHDILGDLVRGGLAPDQARLVVDKAAAHAVQPYTMWLWLQRFDADSLAVVVVADLSHEQILAHFASGRLPDLHELRVFATCNGLRGADAPSSRARRVLVDSRLTPRRLLPIFEPGTWPAAVDPSAARRSERRRRGGLAA